MSRNYAILQKAGLQIPLSLVAPRIEAVGPRLVPHPATAAPPGTYSMLIHRLFRNPAAIAIVSSGSASGASDICEEIAVELAAAGKLVVIVPVAPFLSMNPPPAPSATAFAPGRVPNVWLWPAPPGAPTEFPKYRAPETSTRWLDGLRANFDSVLLDCPAPAESPTSAEVAALADSAVLAAESGVTTKQQVRRDRQALESHGAKLSAAILIKRGLED
jgi:hypothetical protein